MGVVGRGGEVDLENVGVGGTNASWGADLARLRFIPPSVCTPADKTLRFLDEFLGTWNLIGWSGTVGKGDIEVSTPSSIWHFSAFFFSIHHTAPAASHASDSTECTIWAVSKPSRLSVFSNSRSTGVENIIGVGVVRSDAKSISRLVGRGIGECTFSVVGDAGSERVDDTERRFVRAGVRMGWPGGAFDEFEDICRTGKGEGLRGSSS